MTGLRHDLLLEKREPGTKHGPRVLVVAAGYNPLTGPKPIGRVTEIRGNHPRSTGEADASTVDWVRRNLDAVLDHWFGRANFLSRNAPGPKLASPGKKQKGAPAQAPAQAPAIRPVTFVAMVRDHSVSMRSLKEGAMRDFNAQLYELQAAEGNGQDISIRVVKCGVGHLGRVELSDEVGRPSSIRRLDSYVVDGGATPLFDSVGAAIDALNDAARGVPDASFLVMAITDGEENSSRHWSASKLRDEITRLQATDRWTYVFRVPKGYGSKLVGLLGVPSGNVLEWDQTDSGIRQSSDVTLSGIRSYFTARSAGHRGTKAFYTDVSNVSLSEVRSSLADITPLVSVHTISTDIDVSEFSRRFLGRQLEQGTLFYQLTKREPKVQDYKVICVRDKSSGKVYGGDAARKLIGMPKVGTHPVIPGDHGDWDIFIQSTSLNRKLPGGTKVLYWQSANSVTRAA